MYLYFGSESSVFLSCPLLLKLREAAFVDLNHNMKLWNCDFKHGQNVSSESELRSQCDINVRKLQAELYTRRSYEVVTNFMLDGSIRRDMPPREWNRLLSIDIGIERDGAPGAIWRLCYVRLLCWIYEKCV